MNGSQRVNGVQKRIDQERLREARMKKQSKNCHPEPPILGEGSPEILKTQMHSPGSRTKNIWCIGSGALKEHLSPKYRGRSFAQKMDFRMTVLKEWTCRKYLPDREICAAFRAYSSLG